MKCQRPKTSQAGLTQRACRTVDTVIQKIRRFPYIPYCRARRNGTGMYCRIECQSLFRNFVRIDVKNPRLSLSETCVSDHCFIYSTLSIFPLHVFRRLPLKLHQNLLSLSKNEAVNFMGASLSYRIFDRDAQSSYCMMHEIWYRILFFTLNSEP